MHDFTINQTKMVLTMRQARTENNVCLPLVKTIPDTWSCVEGRTAEVLNVQCLYFQPCAKILRQMRTLLVSMSSREQEDTMSDKHVFENYITTEAKALPGC